LAHSKRILVTGASRGIGRAIAIGAAARGNDVALLARDSTDLDAAAQLCREAGGGEIAVLRASVTEATAVQAACSDVLRRWDGLDVLVNNAGLGRYAPFMELDEADWALMLNTNVLGLVNVTRSVLPTLIAQGRGHIVNMCSIRSLETIPGTSAYAASKFAVVGLSMALRQELEGTGVLVSMVHPGGVKTDFGGISAETKDPSFLTPEKIAEVIMSIIEQAPEAWIRELTIMPAAIGN
jgi:3-oxoacyl-[acyl-carrier protein] reductase